MTLSATTVEYNTGQNIIKDMVQFPMFGSNTIRNANCIPVWLNLLLEWKGENLITIIQNVRFRD